MPPIHRFLLPSLAGAALGTLLCDSLAAEGVLLAGGLGAAVFYIIAFVVRVRRPRGTSDAILIRIVIFVIGFVAAVAVARYVHFRAAIRDGDRLVRRIEDYRAGRGVYPSGIEAICAPKEIGALCRYPIEYSKDRESFELSIRIPWMIFGSNATFDPAARTWSF